MKQEFVFKETPLGVYTVQAKSLIEEAVQADRKINGHCRQLASSEVVLKEYGRAVGVLQSADGFWTGAALKERIVQDLKKLRTSFASGTSRLGPESAAACEVLIAKLRGESDEALAKKHGQELVDSVVGSALDPLKTCAVEQLLAAKAQATERAQRDIDAYAEQRWRQRDAEMAEIDKQLKSLRGW